MRASSPVLARDALLGVNSEKIERENEEPFGGLHHHVHDVRAERRRNQAGKRIAVRVVEAADFFVQRRKEGTRSDGKHTA